MYFYFPDTPRSLRKTVLVLLPLKVNVQNVLPKFLDTPEESKDTWRLEKAVMKPVVLAVGTVGTFVKGTVCISATRYCCCCSDRDKSLPQYLQHL